ncbi:MAG: sensor histidine kinase [Alphaproteobacteria bacterium]|nr:MAG: sensor histidine kinase [Alphaproteobacteria bacterium]
MSKEIVAAEPSEPRRSRPSPRVARYVVLAVVALAVVVVWVTNAFLTQRFTETTRSRAELRLALYSAAITTELQRNSVVPLLLARDPVMITSLGSEDYAATSQRLISYRDEIGAASLMLLDGSGRVVAASDRVRLGETLRNEPFFINALRSSDTVFTLAEQETGAFRFFYSRRVDSDKRGIGVIVVEVDLGKLERSWVGTTEAVLVTDSEGRIILATDPYWKGRTVAEALQTRSPPSAISRALEGAAADFGGGEPDAYFRGVAVMRLDARIPFQGWRLTSFTAYDSVRERVNGFLAIEIMGFAMLLALTFYILNRRAEFRTALLVRESAELRRLNARLQREIAEREKVQKSLKFAEQSLAQSQKLAALGEMSAAVSHELNQPLAAMKTYLAGAKLLLQRRRPDEALSSFQRIDDLIERMGHITRQLKSYARKGGEAFEPVALRDVVSSALAMMEPQLKLRKVHIETVLPKEKVMVLGDRIRLEQVVINLLRNALDATSGQDDAEIAIIVTSGETATLVVRDNGPGLEDLDELFEPFYTTKKPGEGVGLGLAISSGIVADHGGRLVARNAEPHGAVFEVQLPLLADQRKGAGKAPAETTEAPAGATEGRAEAGGAKGDAATGKIKTG